MAPSYRFGKGPIVRRFEAHVATMAGLDATLAELVRATAELDGKGLERLTSFELELPKADARHLQQRVFGGDGGRERRLVYYQGLKGALELAKALGTGGTPAPVQVFWGCGQDADECWVSWSSAGGQPIVIVTLLSTVPATAGDSRTTKAVAGFPEDPEDAGMYVVRERRGKAKVFEARPNVGL